MNVYWKGLDFRKMEMEKNVEICDANGSRSILSLPNESLESEEISKSSLLDVSENVHPPNAEKDCVLYAGDDSCANETTGFSVCSANGKSNDLKSDSKTAGFRRRRHRMPVKK